MRRLLAILTLAVTGCAPQSGPEVVVYVAHDELYARPILDAFEEETGIRVRAQYDTEAAKTTGLVNRLIAERNRPRADVFWNNEVVQTIRLENEGLLAPYMSPNAAGIPAKYKDSAGHWTGFAARARVIIYNTELVDEPPRGLRDLLDPKWRGRVAIARPLFGTTATHAAALFAAWGDADAIAYFDVLKGNSVAILAGNATVRDLVARGEYAVGLTDTDDANGAVEDGFPVAWHLTDQDEGALGAMLIPNTVMMLAGAPHQDEAKALIDYLLRPETEAELAATRSIQIPLRPGVETPAKVPRIESLRLMDADFEAAAEALPRATAYMQERFLK